MVRGTFQAVEPSQAALEASQVIRGEIQVGNQGVTPFLEAAFLEASRGAFQVA